MSNSFDEHLQSVSRLFQENRIDGAKSLVLDLEREANDTKDVSEKVRRLIAVSQKLTDIGARSKNTGMLERATDYLISCADTVGSTDLGGVYYCIGTAYSALEELNSSNRNRFYDSENRRKARHYFRLATEQISERNKEEYWTSASWTNYGNLLSDVGRDFESASAYDLALRIRPGLGWALGGKARILCSMGDSMPRYRIELFTEAKRLLQFAIAQQDLTQEARESYTIRYRQARG